MNIYTQIQVFPREVKIRRALCNKGGNKEEKQDIIERMSEKQITQVLRLTRTVSPQVSYIKSFGLHSPRSANEFIAKLLCQYIVSKEKIH